MKKTMKKKISTNNSLVLKTSEKRLQNHSQVKKEKTRKSGKNKFTNQVIQNLQPKQKENDFRLNPVDPSKTS
jgi:hypothetical protein